MSVQPGPVPDTPRPENGEPSRAQVEAQQRARTFNGLTAKEWTQLSRNVWADLSSPRTERHLEHGAVFPVKLAERIITMYSRRGDLVVDPFAGIGSTLIAARSLGRRSLGIELNPRFTELARSWLSEEAPLVSAEVEPRLILGDAREISRHLAQDEIQLSLTSPPYANFIQRSIADRQRTHKKSRLVLDNNSQVKQYSHNPQDFGNLEYPDFLESCGRLLKDLLVLTRPGGYSVWVVKDHRLPPKLPYVPLHSDLAAVAREAGWLWHDLVIWDQNEQRRLILLGYPSRFYTNQNCSFLLVLRRPE